jgi:hypothetical protein
MSTSSQSRVRKLTLCAFLCVVGHSQLSNACSPALPLPTLRESFATAMHVYLARLVVLKRSPLLGEPKMKSATTVEDAVFEVLLTLKGKEPEDNKVRTHTEYFGGNCTRSILHPADVLDENGKDVANPYSDTWILVLDGTEPYTIWNTSHSRPINLFAEAELRFLLEESQRSRPNKSPQETRSEQRASER